MKLALILMIKNEGKILKRCLEAVESVVDAFCICDTGSTDNTVEVANEFLKTRTGCVTVEPWQNFGHNRTISFQNAQAYIRDELKWDLKETYGLLLDADMVFVPAKLKEQNLTAEGYRIIQVNGSLEYYNTRFVRMDYPWKCVSVTHEYWDGPTQTLPKDVCYIDDRNDGGCKHDKFERDQRLLEQGLKDEPQNVRYMFYLAQTYKCMGKLKESIAMYKQRIRAGGWFEEVWYSMYMIGECWLKLGNQSKFEDWMQRAHHYRPQRTESIYKLAEFFRIKGDHYKAYHYTKIGLNTPYPKDDVLFIEGDVYRGKFDYEASILEYYVSQDKKRGLRSSMNSMSRVPSHQQNVLSNMVFYMTPIPSVQEKLDLVSPFGDDFRPSAISVANYPFANVRFVNYWISNGDYFTKDNVPVQTHNAYFNLETRECLAKMDDASVTLPRFDTHVRGLEDLRVYSVGDSYKFTATNNREYEKDAVRVIAGDYDPSGVYKHVSVLKSPFNHPCEKNWLPISGTNMFIYGWHPYRLIDESGSVLKTVDTSPLFNLFRGSAPPIKKGDVYWTLVHLVEYSKPRKYYHCVVELDKTLVPRRVTLPFVFRSPSIEYCVSFRFQNENTIECYVSFMDSDPHRIRINTSEFDWISI